MEKTIKYYLSSFELIGYNFFIAKKLLNLSRLLLNMFAFLIHNSYHSLIKCSNIKNMSICICNTIVISSSFMCDNVARCMAVTDMAKCFITIFFIINYI